MLYNVVVNDWGETTYVPTIAGNILLAVIIALLLAVGVLIRVSLDKKAKAAGKEDAKAEESSDRSFKAPTSTGKLSAKQLAFCAMSIALATVLSNIKVFHFPTGGSITLLSMLIVTLPGYLFGIGPGLLTGIAYGVLQLMIDPYVLFPAQLIVDYLLAFGALGLSGLFSKSKNGLIKGYLAGILGRYVFAVLSGWIFFGSYAWDGWGALPYSMVYNGIYIFSEAIITVIILVLPPVQKAFASIRKLARN